MADGFAPPMMVDMAVSRSTLPSSIPPSAPLRRMPAWPGRRIRRAVWLPCALTMTLVLAGCVSLSKSRDNNVVAARQLSLRGIDALQRGQLTDAELLLGRAIQMCPLDERMQCHYADTLWQLGLRDQAVAHMEEAVRLSGGNPDLTVRLGDMYLASGAVEQAAEQAEAAIQANRQLASAWALRGDVLRRQGKSEESLASYHRALSFQEHSPRVQLAIAETYRAEGRYGRALAPLRTLADGYPGGEAPQYVVFLQGLTLKDLERYDAAVERLALAASHGEPSADLLYHLADARLRTGDPVNARLAIQAALAKDPQHAPSRTLHEQIASLERRLAARVDR
jgi:tetratricopeptide (TPR) repeat protein